MPNANDQSPADTMPPMANPRMKRVACVMIVSSPGQRSSHTNDIGKVGFRVGAISPSGFPDAA